MIIQKLRYKTWWVATGALIMAFLTWSSLSPIIVTVVTVQYSDLVLHLLAYSAVTFWFQQIFRGARGLLLVALCMIGYGMLMEAAQGLLTVSRDANLLDIVANTIGVVIGTFVSSWFAPQGLFLQLENQFTRVFR